MAEERMAVDERRDEGEAAADARNEFGYLCGGVGAREGRYECDMRRPGIRAELESERKTARGATTTNRPVSLRPLAPVGEEFDMWLPCLVRTLPTGGAGSGQRGMEVGP